MNFEAQCRQLLVGDKHADFWREYDETDETDEEAREDMLEEYLQAADFIFCAGAGAFDKRG